MNCFEWKKTICNNKNCEKRIASKKNAIKVNAYRQFVTAHKIGTSIGVYIPKDICSRKNIYPGKKLRVVEWENSVELISPPGVEQKNLQN